MLQSVVAQVFAEEWPKLVATLMRDLSDVDAAEDAAQQAFSEAAAKWGPTTTPDNPGAWLVTTARRRAIDQLRRDQRFDDRLGALAARAAEPAPIAYLEDDQLALIFGCCHPALGQSAQVGLTLRTVCGLSTNQIAAAFMVPEPTMAKRLVRAKAKIRAAGIPFETPSTERLNDRLPSVLAVIYLIFTEGHATADGTTLVRGSLCDEARWLAELVARLLPTEPEAHGLAALLCLTDARRPARVDERGNVVLLEDQDRSLWDRRLVADGHLHLAAAAATPGVGPYQVQAAIAGAHARATRSSDTSWKQIAGLYELLLRLEPTPVVALNRAVAISRASGPDAGLAALEQIDGLESYRYYHSARAEFLQQLDRAEESQRSFELALSLTTNEAERALLLTKLKLGPKTV